MEKILNLKDIIQVFMVSHRSEYDNSDKVQMIPVITWEDYVKER